MIEFLETAKAFATHMDHDNFASAKTFLAEDCQYVSGDKIYNGPSEIMASYKEHSDYAKSTFDSVIYESSVKQLKNGIFEATYKDVIKKNGNSHSYSCKQILEFNSNGKIQKIIHQDILGEYEKLKAFYKKTGVN